jgi:hypothetical protein
VRDGYVVDKLPATFSRYVVSIDFGQQHPTTMLLGGYYAPEKRWYIIKEFYTKEKTVSQFSKEFGTEILSACDVGKLESVDVDAGGGGRSLIEQLRVDYPGLANNARINHAIKSDVAAELQRLSTALFKHEVVYYKPGCKRAIGEMMNYIWDEKAAKLGKDMPVKKDDDGCDATRYMYNRITRLY